MAEQRQTPADTALRLSRYLVKVREQIDSRDTGEPNPFATALSVVAVTVQAAIMNGKILEFAAHCCEFIERESKGESLFPDLGSPESPRSN